MNSEIFKEKAMEVFFASGITGWAGGVLPIEIPQLPGSKMLRYTDGDWLVTDVYQITMSSSRSYGTTTIYYRDQPVWEMQYAGWYAEQAIPVVKAALLDAYQRREFLGGRGTKDFHMIVDDLEMVYQNHVDFNDFVYFFGHDVVIAQSREFGKHWFRGMLLL